MRKHLLLTSALVVALGASAALAQGTAGRTGSTPSNTTTTTPAPTTTNTPGAAPMNTTPGATTPLPPAGTGTPPINPDDATSPATNCIVGTKCATDKLVDPIPPSQCATGRNCFTSSGSASGATAGQPAQAASPASGGATAPAAAASTTAASPSSPGASFNASLCPANISGGCAPTGAVEARAISHGTRLHRVDNPAQTLTGRALYDGKGQSIGQVANVELRKGRPTAVVVVLNDGKRVSLKSSRVVYLAKNNALATRMTPAQLERLKSTK